MLRLCHASSLDQSQVDLCVCVCVCVSVRVCLCLHLYRYLCEDLFELKTYGVRPFGEREEILGA